MKSDQGMREMKGDEGSWFSISPPSPKHRHIPFSF